ARTRLPYCSVAFFVCIIAFLANLSVEVRAQTGGLPDAEGTDILRRLLQESFYVNPLKDVSELDKEREKTLLIVLGGTGKLKNVAGGLDGFLRAGGSALIATDRNTGEALNSFGVQINGEQIQTVHQHAYKGVLECIFVDFDNTVEGLSIFGAHRELSRVATN